MAGNPLLTAEAGVPQRKWSRDVKAHSVYDGVDQDSALAPSD